MASQWIKTESGNEVLIGKGFYLSYNSNPQDSINKHFGMNIIDPNPVPETAVYFIKNDYWLVLEGDFRKEFESCTSIIQCFLQFKKLQRKHGSRWSTINYPKKKQ